MKVCLDIQAAIGRQAGVGRYTRMLAQHLLPGSNGRIHLSLAYFDFRRQGLNFPVNGAHPHALHWVPGRAMQQAWKRFHFPPYNWLFGRADLYHFPNFICPPCTRGKICVTVHDLSFMRMPETTEEKNLHYLTGQIQHSVDRADAVITDSEFSRQEIIELLQVDADRVHAVHLGLNNNIPHADARSVDHFRHNNHLDRPYLLFVSTVEPRKNIPFLVEVFERMERFDGDLVIAGMRGWKSEPIFKRINNSTQAARIRYLEYVPNEDMAALYAGASMFLFPSRYEGFGFPPLEAMAAGIPVVASPGGSLREVLGDGAVILEPADPDEWAGRIQYLLEHPTDRDQLIQRGTVQVRKYNWEKTARETVAIYHQVTG